MLGYGVIGGFGLGLAYIVPIAMLQKWFPDKRGLITGLAVGGFGFGAVLTAPVGQRLIDAGPVDADQGVPAARHRLPRAVARRRAPSSATRPPATSCPATSPRDARCRRRHAGQADYTQREALRTPQWYLLTAILTLSVTAGISLISSAAGSATDIAGYSAAGGREPRSACSALFNGGGRILWGWLSDRIGRMPAFMGDPRHPGRLPAAHPARRVSRSLFAVLAALVYLCYGGAFGTMPSTAGRLLRRPQRRRDLRPDADRLEPRRHRRPAAHRLARSASRRPTRSAYTVIGIIALVGMALPHADEEAGAPDRALVGVAATPEGTAERPLTAGVIRGRRAAPPTGAARRPARPRPHRRRRWPGSARAARRESAASELL